MTENLDAYRIIGSESEWFVLVFGVRGASGSGLATLLKGCLPPDVRVFSGNKLVGPFVSERVAEEWAEANVPPRPPEA